MQGNCNGFQHAIDVAKDVVIPKPQNAISMIGEPLIACCIVLVGCVLSAIDLNDQPLFATNEVNGVRADRFLPDKFVASESARANAIPFPHW